MKINCPHCETKLDAGEELYGEVVKCPNCNEEIAIPFKATATTTLLKKVKKKKVKKNTTSKKDKSKNIGEYKTPILAAVFKWLAIVGIILIVIFTVVLIILASSSEQLPREAPLVYIGAFVSILMNFGLSQLIEFFAKTAYYAEKISGQIDKLK